MLEPRFRENATVIDKINFFTTSSTMTIRDQVVRADATSAGFTITLPKVADAKGLAFSILATVATTSNTVTVQDSDESQGWPGDFVLSSNNEMLVLYSDGLAWSVLYWSRMLEIQRTEQAFMNIGLTALREAASNAIKTSYTRTKTVDVPLGSVREVASNDIQNLAAHGGIMAKDSIPIYEHTNGDTDSNHRLRWAAAAVDPITFKVNLPGVDDSADVVVRLRAALSDTTDTVTFSSDAYFNEGDTKVEDSVATVTGTTVTNYDITIGAADVPSGAATLSVELTPSGNTNDAIHLYAIQVIYTETVTGVDGLQGLLGPSTTPILDFTNGDTDSALRLQWAAGNQDPVVFQTALPPDLDVSANLVLHVRAAMSGTDDTPTIASDAYFNEGDTKVEDASAAITGATYAEYTITIAAADVPTGAQTLTVELTPGAHATNALYITSIWLEYTRQLLTT